MSRWLLIKIAAANGSIQVVSGMIRGRIAIFARWRHAGAVLVSNPPDHGENEMSMECAIE